MNMPPEGHTLPTHRVLPSALFAVAWLFIILGIISAVEIALSAAMGRISPNVGVLGILVGRGLMRCNRAWRICALVLLGLGCVLMFLLTLLALGVFVSGGQAVAWIGTSRTGIPAWMVPIAFAGLFLTCLWAFRVLRRPNVEWYFGVHHTTTQANEWPDIVDDRSE